MKAQAGGQLITLRPQRQRHQKQRWREAGDIFEFRDEVRSQRGPKSPTTRWLLIALSLWCNGDERRCWPSQQTLARQTGLSLRAVKRHLQIADDEGWLFRSQRRKKGKAWKYTVYELTLPVDGGDVGAPT